MGKPRGTGPVTASGLPPPRTAPGRPDLPEIVLHLGAHRTGSTRLQYVLDANRDALATNATVALTPPRPGKRVSPTIRDVLALVPTGRCRPVRHYLRLRKARAMFRDLVADRPPGTPPAQDHPVGREHARPRFPDRWLRALPVRVSAPRRTAQAPGPSALRGASDASRLRCVPGLRVRHGGRLPARRAGRSTTCGRHCSPSTGAGRTSSTTWPARFRERRSS